MLTGEGITPAQGLRFEREEKKVRNVTASSAQPRVTARAFSSSAAEGQTGETQLDPPSQ